MASGPFSSIRWGKNLFILISGLIILITILFYTLPLISLILRITPAEFITAICEPNVRSAITLSLVTATTATIIVVLLGTPLAYMNARIDYPGRKFIETLIDVPIVLPPSVAGLALLVLFGRRGLIGSYFSEFGITIIFTSIAVIIAQIFVAGPLYIRQAKSAFAMVDQVYESAARTLGAGRLLTFIKVTVPLARTGLISGIILPSFCKGHRRVWCYHHGCREPAWKTQTMPLVIYGFMQSDYRVNSLSIVLIAISFYNSHPNPYYFRRAA